MYTTRRFIAESEYAEVERLWQLREPQLSERDIAARIGRPLGTVQTMVQRRQLSSRFPRRKTSYVHQPLGTQVPRELKLAVKREHEPPSADIARVDGRPVVTMARLMGGK